MKLNLNYTIIILCSWILGSCSTMDVTIDYDPEFNYSKLKTFNWIKKSDNKNILVVKQIRHALDLELEKNGIIQNSTNPDILIAIHVEKKDKVIVTNYGYEYGGWWGGRHGVQYGGLDVYEYKEGTLIIDFIDSGSNKLIFRSTVVAELSRNYTAEKRQAKIKEAVEKALESFPPTIKKDSY